MSDGVVALAFLEVFEAPDEEVVVGEGDGDGEGGSEEVNEGVLELPLVDGLDGGIGTEDGEEELHSWGEREAVLDF